MYAAAASSHRHRDTTVSDNRTHTQGTQHEHNGQCQATDLFLVLKFIVTAGRLSYYVATLHRACGHKFSCIYSQDCTESTKWSVIY